MHSSIISGNLVRTFTLHLHGCVLRVGDTVLPETPIGLDFDTGKPLNASCRGTVASMHYGGEDYPLVVVVTPE